MVFPKKFAEQALQELISDSFKVAIVRPPMIYGAHCPGNFQRLMQLSKATANHSQY